MVLASAAVFLLPLVAAIAGALWNRGGPSGQVTGALAGFAVGVLAASVIIRLIRRHGKALA